MADKTNCNEHDSVKYSKYNQHHRATEKEAIGFALVSWGNVIEIQMFDLDLERRVPVPEAKNGMTIFI